MTPTQREAALRLADWLHASCVVNSEVKETIALLRELAAEPAQEPVAWLYESASGSSFLHRGFTNVRFEADMRASKEYPDGHKMTPLYIHPPQQRQPLTRQQVQELLTAHFDNDTLCGDDMTLVRAVEAAHGITGSKE